MFCESGTVSLNLFLFLPGVGEVGGRVWRKGGKGCGIVLFMVVVNSYFCCEEG